MNAFHQRGMTLDCNGGNDILSKDHWDDEIILKIFDEAIKSHSVKGTSHKKKRKLLAELAAAENAAPVGEPGPWIEVESVPAAASSSATKQVKFSLEDEYTRSHQALREEISDTPVPIPIPSLGTSSSASSLVEGALHEMLNAWYQSGYATGRYYTLLEMQQQQHSDTSSHIECDPTSNVVNT